MAAMSVIDRYKNFYVRLRSPYLLLLIKRNEANISDPNTAFWRIEKYLLILPFWKKPAEPERDLTKAAQNV